MSLNLLKTHRIFGIIEGYFVSGVIDEIQSVSVQVQSGKANETPDWRWKLFDTKTR
jgi:hypothetical protein